MISYCTIENNYAAEDGGGIFCEDSNPTIEYCLIRNNDANHKGGGIQLENNANPVIRYCTIIENIADFGGGICCYGTDPEIVNSTIYNNEALFGGGVSCLSNAAPTIKNTIFAGTVSGYGIYLMSSPNTTLTYCDFYDNLNAHYAGSIPSGIGILVGVNANGDSCDTYHNIFLDPMFVDPPGGDFHLQEGSPCIDAGDPSSPLDPDNTIADIGAFYFDQGAASPVSVTLTPYNPPIQIPAAGGSFDYNIAVTVNETTPQTFDLWIMVTLPSGAQVGPVLGPVNATLPGGATVDRDRTQGVPGNAPAGNYSYTAYLGSYPNVIWDEDSFDFEKLGTGYGSAPSEWKNWGEDFDELTREISGSLPSKFALHGAFPNPFNPTTAMSFSLPQTSHAKLTVYDISGHLVAVLVNGQRDAGLHEVSFDATNLASGLYVYRLVAGEFTAVKKMVLMK